MHLQEAPGPSFGLSGSTSCVVNGNWFAAQSKPG